MKKNKKKIIKLSKQEANKLLKKYHLDESHGIWNSLVDNWLSVEVWRKVHNGELPPQDVTIEEAEEEALKTPMAFLDNKKLHKKMLKQDALDFGRHYLTAKRMLYSAIQKIVEH